ncbi:hypothetical protein NQ317_016074 [Molorchus minor]|uniref:Uncharacterized protein n=1 Tax=Molorchus minor TaxID=1323400 RepID=A0ABQ9IW45_9CUCU|nr:hypothetical protein NQ317_016074 [Molorchus minor]
MVKVVLILGISGACRCEELTKTTPDDLEDKDSILIVKVSDAKNEYTVFTVSILDYIDIYRKYAALRPSYAIPVVDCFFNCRNKLLEIKMPSSIAKYLKLPNFVAYTGHCFRRTIATLLRNAGAIYDQVLTSTAIASTSKTDSFPTSTPISRAASNLSGLGINIGWCTGCTINVNIVNLNKIR